MIGEPSPVPVTPLPSVGPRIIIAVLGLAFLILGIRSIAASSPTTDEPGHYRYGHRILRGVAERWDDSKMPVSALNALPCFISEKLGSPGRDADEFSGPCDWTLARVPTLMGGLALGLAIAAWSRALFGWTGALVSFSLFAFDPNLLAHSTLVTTDIFGALGLLLSLRAFGPWRVEPGVRQSLVLGLAVGGASISKYTAAYLPLIFLAAFLLSGKAVPESVTHGARRWALGLVIIVVVALVVINVGFLFDDTFGSLRDQNFESPQFRELRKIPVVAHLPLPVPRPFVEGLDRVFHRERHGGGSGNIYFLGELRSPGSEGFKTYFLVVGFLKTPIPALLALFLAWVLLVRRRRVWSVDEITLIATVVIFSLYFSLLFRAQIGLRHYLVVIPPLFVLAGCVGPFLARSRARVAAGVLAVVLSAASVVRHGDDPLSYFNELIDPSLTYRVAADSNLDWGQSRGKIDAYLAANPDVLLAPARPFPGRILVGANPLTGVVTRKRMEWLRQSGKTPIGHVAFTHFLFEFTPAEADQLRRERGDPPLRP